MSDLTIMFGFAQIKGVTCPAITTTYARKTGFWTLYHPQLGSTARSDGFQVYQLTEYEFYKWFGWTPLEQFIMRPPDLNHQPVWNINRGIHYLVNRQDESEASNETKN